MPPVSVHCMNLNNTFDKWHSFVSTDSSWTQTQPHILLHQYLAYRGTALQAGRSRIRFPNVTGMFHWLDPSGRPRNVSWDCCPVRRADNHMCRLFGNPGASTSWNPQGLSRSVMGLLYLFTFNYWHTKDSHWWEDKNFHLEEILNVLK